MNEYTEIADYYDLFMTSGYYNYEKIATAIATLVSPNQTVLEIGVGTGLILEKLLEINSQYNLTGIDHTPAMLDIAKKRLGDQVKLLEADIVSMPSSNQFDVAISNGGLCAFVDTGDEYDFYTHLPDDESNIQALQNVANSLYQSGWFIINIQGIHDNYEIPLPGGIFYSQEVIESPTYPDCIDKTFYFKKDAQILAQMQLTYRIFKGQAIEELFNQAGFKWQGKDESGQFFICSKK
jgi:SAM-dependent methyltransferase